MVYLDNAATSYPKPKTVIEAVLRQMESVGGNPGRSEHQGGLAASRVMYETRHKLATLLGVTDPLRIIFTSNATDSLNLAIKGILKPGDHVMTTSMEHNSVLRPLEALKESGVEVKILEADAKGMVQAKDFEEALQPNTKMLIVTHCSNVTGTIQPVESIIALARHKGILSLVDASQSTGSIDYSIHQMDPDLLAAPGHKALLGPQGTGFLYLKEGVLLQEMKQGGTGSQSENLYQPMTVPDRYESGTQNAHGLAGLQAGVDFLLRETVSAVQEKERNHIQRLKEGLSVIKGVRLYGPEDVRQQGAVQLFTLRDLDQTQLNYLLDQLYGISARAGLHCAPLAHKTVGTYPAGAIRFSPGYFTTKEEIDQALAAVQQLALDF
ncbi:aminotransferase class V-fold PLP-dependent enzyme [Tindallia californiensis]|uniref:cysteine desulfurase n=1 Tax=Tindallia californiensis TaxID=159292 RepID=A0A1H3QJ83_9FIRM|nr:aminotransferase class V-fold PLP-dependent enzyme [Tindallia californiensis]SDZ13476.1 cysteine desulfurase family protein [Tindallia californiensis]